MHDSFIKLIEVIAAAPCMLDFYRSWVVSIRNKHLEKLACTIFKRLRWSRTVYILPNKHVIGIQFLYYLLNFLLNR